MPAPFEPEDLPPGMTMEQAQAAWIATNCQPLDPAKRNDPEVLAALVELGALQLTTSPRSSFAEDELVAACLEYADPKAPPDDAVLREAVRASGSLRQLKNGRWRLR